MPRTIAILAAAVLVLAGGAGGAASGPGRGTIVFSSFLPEYPLPDTFQADRTFVVGAGGASRELAAGDLLSPDGSRIASVRGGAELWVSNVDGTNAHRVAAPGTTVSTVTWSNDGSRLAFLAGGVWVVGADGSGLREIFAPPNEKTVLPTDAWSPDETELVAFADNDTWLVAADGSTQRLIFKPPVLQYGGPDDVVGVDWAPRTDAIALTVATDLCGPGTYEDCINWYAVTFDRAGDRLANLGSALDVAWSPDGRKLAFESGDFLLQPDDVGIATANADGTHLRWITSRVRKLDGKSDCWQYPTWVDAATVAFEEALACDGIDVSPEVGFALVRDSDGRIVWQGRGKNESFSPGGRRFAFIRQSGGVSILDAVDLRAARPRPVGIAARSEPAVWSPDGSQLAFTTHTADGRHRDLDVMRAGGGAIRRVVRLAADRTLRPAWFGTRLTYTSRLAPSAKPLLWTVRPDGTGLRKVPNGAGAVDPSWSPDGRRIAFADVVEIETMGGDGSARRGVAVGENAWYMTPSWSPDGKTIVYSRSSVGTFTVRAAGGASRRIGPETELSSQAWSPDGTRIAYAKSGDLHVMNADGTGDTTVLQSCCGAPAWSPDGTRLAFTCRTCAAGFVGIAVANADGSDLRPVVANLPGDDGAYPDLEAPAWSPDGSELVFSGTACTADPKGPPAICIVAPDGTGLRAVTPPGIGSFAPSWTAAGG